MNKNLKVILGSAAVALACAGSESFLPESIKRICDAYEQVEAGTSSLHILGKELDAGVEESIANGRRGIEGLEAISQVIKPVFSFLSNEAQLQYQQGVTDIRTSLKFLVSSAAAHHFLMRNLVDTERIVVGETEYRRRITDLQKERDAALNKNKELTQRIAIMQKGVEEKVKASEMLTQQLTAFRLRENSRNDSEQRDRDVISTQRFNTISAMILETKEAIGQQIKEVEMRLKEGIHQDIEPMKDDMKQILENSLL